MTPLNNGSRNILERELLQDFCLLWRDLEEQFIRFERTQTVSSSVLHDLVGTGAMKGLLWRIKDNSHVLFGDEERGIRTGRLLDWVLGYIFHEAIKLQEDAHLEQAYLSRLPAFLEKHAQMPLPLLSELSDMRAHTLESAAWEIDRLKKLMRRARQLFCEYFADRADHRPLARFLYDRNELVRQVFKEDYEQLITMVYRDEPERMYLEAAASLRESVRMEEAGQALAAALVCRPDCDYSEGAGS